VAKLVVGITYKCIPHGGVGIKLMLATRLSLPKSASHDKEAVGSANKMGQRIGQ